jgi:hypothetical protein
MKNSVIAIQSCMITTTIIYALLVPVFFEMENNAIGEEKYFVDDNNDKTTYSQQVVSETKECKSPCPSSAEMCIEICA